MPTATAGAAAAVPSVMRAVALGYATLAVLALLAGIVILLVNACATRRPWILRVAAALVIALGRTCKVALVLALELAVFPFVFGAVFDVCTRTSRVRRVRACVRARARAH